MKRRLLVLFVLMAAAATALPLVPLSSRSPLVTIRLLFSIGSARDPAGQEGLASLTAAMLADGGTRSLTYQDTIRLLYPTAASVHSQVDKEMSVFYGTCHVDTVDRFYRLMSDKLLTPGWREDDLARVKGDLLNSIIVDLRGNNDEELGKEALYSFIYLDHPYGHPDAGLVHAVQKLTMEDVKSFYSRYYTTGNLTVGLAGGYPGSLPARVRRDFGHLGAGTAPVLRLPPPGRIDGIQVEIIQKDARATAISLGFPISINRSSPDFAALWLATSWLGEHRSDNSRLFQRMRELRGLNYGDYAYIEYFPGGMFSMHPAPNLARQQQIFQIWIRPVEPQNAHFALRNALYELQKLVDHGLSAQDFEDTRRFLSKYMYLGLQTQDQQLGYALDSRYYHIGCDTDTLHHALDRLTVADVNRVIKRCLQTRHVKVAMVAGDSAPALAQALVSDTPSPIHYDAAKPPDLLAEDKIISTLRLHIGPEDLHIVQVGQVFR